MKNLFLFACCIAPTAVLAQGQPQAFARHAVVAWQKAKKNASINDRVFQSYLEAESTADGRHPVQTFAQLTQALTLLNQADAQFGSVIQKSVTDLRTANPSLQLVSAGAIDDVYQLAEHPILFLSEEPPVLSDETKAIGTPSRLGEIREDVAVEYVLTEALMKAAPSQSYRRIRSFAAAILQNPKELKEADVRSAICELQKAN
jgi:hypothetical protein